MMEYIGQQLGNYRLLRLIAHGGFADVYLGEHVYLQTQAAVKVLHLQLTDEAMSSFLHEARIIAHLIHPRIVRVLDFGFEKHIPFLVMTYAPRGTLRQSPLFNKTVPLPLIVSCIKQVASALHYAHTQRVIHRDVKPENVLLEQSTSVLLSDFGIATISQTTRSVQMQSISGTASYMAPEQIEGKACPASDQYALAIMAYEWLTGKCPFLGSFPEVVAQHLSTPPRALHEIASEIPAEVEQIILTALAKTPTARFASIEAFADALEQASQPFSSRRGSPFPFAPPSRGEVPINDDESTFIKQITPLSPTVPPVHPLTPPLAGASSPLTHTQIAFAPSTHAASPFISRARHSISRRVALAGLLTGIATTAGILLGWKLFASGSLHPLRIETPPPSPSKSPSQPTASPTQPDHPTPAPTSPGSTVFVYEGLHSPVFTVTWSPDGRHIACAGLSPLIEIWDPSSGAPFFTYHTQSSRVFSVAWSPDGKTIASGHLDGSIGLWNATGESLTTLTGHTKHVNAVCWSPDSLYLASASADTTVMIWDVMTGNPVYTYIQHTAYVNTVRWAPDGTVLASGGGDQTVHIWKPFTQTTITTYRGHTDEILSLSWSPDSVRVASAGVDSTAQVWSPFKAIPAVIYRGHQDFVVALDWSPDGSRIVSGGGDHTKVFTDTTAQVWNPGNGDLFFRYAGHRNEIEGIAWSPDGRSIASASDDTTVQIWHPPV